MQIIKEDFMVKIDEFINWANENCWDIVINNNNIDNIPKEIQERYDIPEEYKRFLETIKKCINADENIWFLCMEDYLPKPEGEFRWNEFEIMSLEAAEEDDDQESIIDIKNFWDKHLPIIMNVKNEYEYYAINMENRKIVHGFEPLFEETDEIAKNFAELLEKIIKKEIVL